MPHHDTLELTAFGATCPRIEDVTDILADLGLGLVFQLSAFRATSNAPALAAQYHFQGCKGAEVLFLAGKDTAMDGARFPAHASRWWVFPGADPVAYRQIVQTLSERYALTWQQCDDQGSEGRQAVA